MDTYIYFMPLGGGQNVGASSYYMKLGNSNIIMDAGVNYEDDLIVSPDFSALLYSGYIESLKQIEQIYISHAHKDHIGYLLETMIKCGNPNVFMTKMTYLLTKYQLYDKNCFDGREYRGFDSIIKKNLLEKVIKVSYLENRIFKDYKATFLQAGHIPGAMMTYFRYKNRNILYTGDCTINSTPLTSGCILPKGKVDILILCGLNTKNPSYKKINNNIYKIIEEIYIKVLNGQSIMCVLPQLSKGVEFLRILNRYNKNGIKIYIDESVLNVVKVLEEANIKMLNENCKILSPKSEKDPHIYITSYNGMLDNGKYEVKRLDFSLHDDYEETKKLIKTINPEKAVIVHTGKDENTYTVEQELLKDPDCRTQFIFPENGKMYCI